MRIHDGFVEFRMFNHALEIHLHVADETQALHFRFQRTNTVRQCLRQHRNHKTREIYRCRTIGGFIVKRRTGAHIMRHIGNGDDQAETFAITLAIHRVIEILGVFTIDGDQRHFA